MTFLTSNCSKFAIIKTGIVNTFPNARELHCVADSKPILFPISSDFIKFTESFQLIDRAKSGFSKMSHDEQSGFIGKQKLSYQHFRICVFPFDLAHIVASGLFVVNIGHNVKVIKLKRLHELGTNCTKGPGNGRVLTLR